MSKKTNKSFYRSEGWLKLRYRALKAAGGRCGCCGISAAEGAVLNVDHIKPRSRYPHLALTLSNLQVLCAQCNRGKGAWDQTEWAAGDSFPDKMLDIRALIDLRERGLLH